MRSKAAEHLFAQLVKIKDEINQQIPLAANRYEEFECHPANLDENEEDKRYFQHEQRLKTIKIEYYSYTYIQELLKEYTLKHDLPFPGSLNNEHKERVKLEIFRNLDQALIKIRRTERHFKATLNTEQIKEFIETNLDLIIEKVCRSESLSPEHMDFEKRVLQSEQLLEIRATFKSYWDFGELVALESERDKFLKYNNLISGVVLERLNTKVGFCDEHTILALNKIFDRYLVFNRLEKLSIVYLDDNLEKDDGHVFLAVNRNQNSKLNHIPSWGRDAILVDPWNKLVCWAEDFESLPLRYTSFPPGLLVEGVEHCARWKSLEFTKDDRSLIYDIKEKDTYFSLTNHLDYQKREKALFEEYRLSSIDEPQFAKTKAFLKQILNDNLPEGFNRKVNIFITADGYQFVRPLAGFNEPTIGIHKHFLSTNEKKTHYNIDELKFGLVTALMQMQHCPLDFEKIEDKTTYDVLALNQLGNGAAAISYLQKNAQFKESFKEIEEFNVCLMYKRWGEESEGLRVKHISALLAQNEKIRGNETSDPIPEEVISEVSAIATPTFFDHKAFDLCKTKVEKIDFLRTRLPELHKELIPFEVTDRPSVRVKEFTAMLKKLSINLKKCDQADAVDKLINTAFDLKLPSFDYIYMSILKVPFFKYRQCKVKIPPLGIFKSLQALLDSFTTANDFKTALETGQNLLALLANMQTHFLNGYLQNHFDKKKLVESGKRYFCSAIGAHIRWKSFTWHQIHVKAAFPKKPKADAFYLVYDEPALYYVNHEKQKSTINIDDVEDLAYLLKNYGSEIYRVKERAIQQIANYVLKQQGGNLPWDQHVKWAREDETKTIAKAMFVFGVVRDKRVWENFDPIELRKYIHEHFIINDSKIKVDDYLYPLVKLKGQYVDFGDSPAYFITVYEATKYFSIIHKLNTAMFNDSNSFETAFTQYYDANLPALVSPGEDFNNRNDAIKFLLNKFADIALSGTLEEKQVVKSFFLGRKDKRDFKNLTIYDMFPNCLPYDSLYIEFFLMQRIREERLPVSLLEKVFEMDINKLQQRFHYKAYDQFFIKLKEKDFDGIKRMLDQGEFKFLYEYLEKRIVELSFLPEFRGRCFQLFTIEEVCELYRSMHFRKYNLMPHHYIAMFNLTHSTVNLACLKELLPYLEQQHMSEAISCMIDHHLENVAKYQIISHEAAELCEFIYRNLKNPQFTAARNRMLASFNINLPSSSAEISVSCDELISIYRTFDNALQFKSIKVQQHFGRLILEKISLINDIDEQIATLQNLLFISKDRFNLPLNDIQFRDDAVKLLVKNMLIKYGKDSGQSSYVDLLKPAINNIYSKTTQRDSLYIFSQLANRLQLQADLCEHIGIFFEPEKYLQVGLTRPKSKHDEKNSLITFVCFLGKDKQDRSQVLNFLSSPLSNESVDSFAEYLVKHDKIDDLVELLGDRNERYYLDKPGVECVIQLNHKMFWACTMQQRAVIIEYLLIPADSVINEEKIKEAYEEAFVYVTHKVFPRSELNSLDYDENENFAVSFLKAYLDTANKYMKNYLLAAMLVTSNEIDNTKASVGKKLANLCEHLGPAYVKLGQAIHSFPNTPENIRKDLEHLKGRANPLERWQLWRIIHEVVPENERHKINYMEEVLGSASFNIAVAVKYNGIDAVLLLLRENASKEADEGFTHLRTTLNLCQHKKIIPIRQTAIDLIDEAKELSIKEIDHESGDIQGEIAKNIYHSLLEINIAKIKYKIQILPSETIQSGPGYRFITRVYGVEYNDLPTTTAEDISIKTAIAKGVIATELSNILGGSYFDCDRHGNQLKVYFDHQTDTIQLGLYDFGEMATTEPNPVEIKQLAQFIRMMPQLIKENQSLVLHFSKYINSLFQKGEPVQYIMRIRKGILALQDFQKYLDAYEMFEILNFIFFNSKLHTDIKSALLLSYGEHSLLKLVTAVKNVYSYSLSAGSAFFSLNKSDKKHSLDNGKEEIEMEELNSNSKRVEKPADPHPPKKLKVSPLISLNHLDIIKDKKRKSPDWHEKGENISNKMLKSSR